MSGLEKISLMVLPMVRTYSTTYLQVFGSLRLTYRRRSYVALHEESRSGWPNSLRQGIMYLFFRVVYQDNISHLFYPEYNRKIEVSKVKNCTYLLLIYSKSSKKRARRNSAAPVTHF